MGSEVISFVRGVGWMVSSGISEESSRTGGSQVENKLVDNFSGVSCSPLMCTADPLGFTYILSVRWISFSRTS